MSDSQGAPDAYDNVDFSDHEANALHEGEPTDPATEGEIFNDEGQKVEDGDVLHTDHDEPHDPGHSYHGGDLQWVPEARDQIGDIEDDSVYEQTNKGTATAAWVNGKSLAHNRAESAYAKPYVFDQREALERLPKAEDTDVAERAGEPQRPLPERRVGQSR